MTATAPRYLVTAVDLAGDGADRTRSFRDPECADAWADRETGRYSDVELLVMLPGARPVAVKDRAALAGAAEGKG